MFVTVGCNTDDVPEVQGGIAFDEMKEVPEHNKIGAKMLKETCTDTLTHIALIRQLVDVLYSVGCLQNFVYLVKYIADGTMSSQLCNFYCFAFRKEMKQFWEVVYRVCKGKGLRLFIFRFKE